MHSTTPLYWRFYVDVHFHWILNRCAKFCPALQSNLMSLSLNMYCGGSNNVITSFLKNFITPSELNTSAGIAQATGHFEIYSTATIRYWFPPFVRGSGPAKSMHHVWNNPLIGILPANFFGSLVRVSDRYHSSSRRSPLFVAYWAIRNDLAQTSTLN